MIASTPRSNLRVAAAAALLSLSSLAFAQTPPAAPAAPAPPVPAPTCESPGALPTAKPGMNTADNFQKKVDNYGTCMKAYVAEHRTAAEAAVAAARAHQDAANEAVGKYNDYVNALNEQQAKANR